MMGSGKSTVGTRLAERTHRQFADTDDLVETATKMTVRQIFAEHGEEEFRRLEALILAHALRVAEPGVIGCGGGMVTRAEARALLKNGQGYVVWLRARPVTLADRLQGVTDRPLLDGDPVGNLGRLAGERAGWYQEVADLVVDVDERDVEGVVEQILAVVAA